MAKSFRELKVWNEAVDLASSIYEVTAKFPKHELYGLTSQMRRAAVSIPSNIAEGSARSSKRDFRQFVLIAKGSVCELQTQIVIARRLKYVQHGDFLLAEQQLEQIARMLSGLASYLSLPAKPKPAIESSYNLEPGT